MLIHVRPGALGEMRGGGGSRVRVIPTKLSSCRSPEYFPLDEGHSRKGTMRAFFTHSVFL